MNRAEIKSAIEKLVPDIEMEQRLCKSVSQKQYNSPSLKSMTIIAASFAIVVSLTLFGHNHMNKKIASAPDKASLVAGVYIPDIKLPEKTGTASYMIGLIVYQGRIYTQCDTRISPESAEKLLGEKLGTTKGNLDEWSKQKDYAVELASSIGKADVYTVKDYDKSFRIMTYVKEGDSIYAQFFECFNGTTIKSGNDIFSKLKLENNIKSAKLETFESWNNNKKQYKEIKNLQAVNNFVNELKNTIPYTQESLSYLFNEQGNSNQKFIYLTLKNDSEVQLRLLKGGYILYASSHVFCKMEDKVFNEIWSELE